MRGNIGSELEGLFTNASDGPVIFVPAYPQLNRVTRLGIHYADGVPISQTVFGRDIFNPVQDDYIPDIIARQTDLQTKVITRLDLTIRNAFLTKTKYWSLTQAVKMRCAWLQKLSKISAHQD